MTFDQYKDRYSIRPLVSYDNRYWYCKEYYMASNKFAFPSSFFRTHLPYYEVPYYSDYLMDEVFENRTQQFLCFKTYPKPPKTTRLICEAFRYIVGSNYSSYSNEVTYNVYTSLFDTLSKSKGGDIYISTRFFSSPHFINVLDIDDGSYLDKILYHLSYNGIGFALYESSPGRYWIILDIITESNFLYVSGFYNSIPGVDPKFLELCSKLNEYPKLRALYKKDKPYPVKFLKSTIESPEVTAYVSAFNQHWVEQAYTRLLK